MTEPTLTFPTAALFVLRQAIESIDRERGPAALREAGRTWADIAERHLRTDDAPLGAMSPSGFWDSLSRFLQGTGWGRVEHEDLGAVGAIRALEWAESDPSERRPDPGCHFSTGFWGELLSRVATQPVAVMEVECRSRGDSVCRFLFGAPVTLDRVHAALSAGASLDAALQEIRPAV